MLVKLDANLEAVRSLLNYFRDTNNSQTVQPAQDLVLVVPNDGRSNASLQVDFLSAKDDVRILTIVSGQRRNHQVFKRIRSDLAAGFEDASAHIRLILGEQGTPSL